QSTPRLEIRIGAANRAPPPPACCAAAHLPAQPAAPPAFALRPCAWRAEDARIPSSPPTAPRKAPGAPSRTYPQAEKSPRQFQSDAPTAFLPGTHAPKPPGESIPKRRRTSSPAPTEPACAAGTLVPRSSRAVPRARLSRHTHEVSRSSEPEAAAESAARHRRRSQNAHESTPHPLHQVAINTSGRIPSEGRLSAQLSPALNCSEQPRSPVPRPALALPQHALAPRTMARTAATPLPARRQMSRKPAAAHCETAVHASRSLLSPTRSESIRARSPSSTARNSTFASAATYSVQNIPL